ncbi:MAG: TetR/AcrR family transcriptional regulator, partial [Spirochaetales bacterium]|nr:TetR/AcrR family transcriptional regulator [Spirochaetales bacterium]
MIRVSKAPYERKEEIISAAQMLFIEKGFVQTKVSDIVKAVCVSQGVFYYYFDSKEEIIDAIVDRYIRQLIESTADIVGNTNIDVTEKLKFMSERQLTVNRLENNNIHSIKGVDIHERILRRLVLDYVPIMHKAFDGEVDTETLYKLEIFLSAG